MESGQFETKVYKKRWFVLVLLVCLNFLMSFTYVTFGFLNNILVAYFNTSYAAVDWITLGHNIGIFMVAPLVGWMASREIISYKSNMLVSACFQVLNTGFVVVGFTWPSLFAFVIAGQILGGVSTAFLWTVPSALAQIWFPESQIGIATGIGLLGMSAGGSAGYFLPSQLLRSPFKFNESTSIEWINSTSLNWFQLDKYIYQWLFCILLLASAVIAVLLLVVPALPEKSPSVAQYLKRIQRLKSVQPRDRQSFAAEITKLLFDKIFLALTFASTITIYFSTFFELSIEAIVGKIHIGSNTKPEKISGYVMTLYGVGGTIGNLVSGLVLDKFKKYYLQAILGATINFANFVSICITVYLRVLWPLYILVPFGGFVSKFNYLPLVDSIMQHTYPIDPVTIMAVYAFYQNVVAVSFVEIDRQIIFYTGLMLGLVFIGALMLLVIIISVFFKPKTNRLSAEESQNKNDSETVPLISSSNN